jgi:heterodisulfide reductase subunit C
MSTHETSATGRLAEGRMADPMPAIWEKVRACMQCGTCTASCGSSNAMDYTPRQMWRMVQLGMKEDLFNSRTFWLCSSCYYCTLRCPRGLPLTETIGALKRMAIGEGRFRDKKSPLFYKTFMNTIRRYGRVREMELMARYFLSLRNPVVPVGFTPLGVKLLVKGKITPRMPTLFGKGKLDAIFRKVRELEQTK